MSLKSFYYGLKAKRETSFSLKTDYLRTAWRSENNREKRQNYKNQAAIVYFEQAQVLNNKGDLQGAFKLVKKAKFLTTDESIKEMFRAEIVELLIKIFNNEIKAKNIAEAKVIASKLERFLKKEDNREFFEGLEEQIERRQKYINHLTSKLKKREQRSNESEESTER